MSRIKLSVSHVLNLILAVVIAVVSLGLLAESADLSEIGHDPRRALIVKVLLRNNGTAELRESFVANVPPGTHASDPPMISLEYFDDGGHQVGRRNAWDPRWQFQEGEDGREEKIELSEAIGSFGFLLSPDMATVKITDQQTGLELISVSVSAAITQYCTDNPDDTFNCIDETDSDSDGVPDFIDNCTEVANMMQTDIDFDGYGNACDGDLNNDNFVNSLDLGIFKQMFMFSGNIPADFNDDFIVNSLDLGMFKQMFFKPPGPSASFQPGP